MPLLLTIYHYCLTRFACASLQTFSLSSMLTTAQVLPLENKINISSRLPREIGFLFLWGKRAMRTGFPANLSYPFRLEMKTVHCRV